MATVIQIKRSGVAGSPAELAQGELAYSYLADNGSNGGDRLYIGTGTETDGVAADIEVIGGIYFTSKYPSTFGAVEASKLLSTDSNSAINTLNIGNSTTVGGTLKLNEGTNNGSHFIAIKAPNAVTADTTLTLPDGVGSNGQVLTTDGSTGALSWSTISSTIQLAADSGSPDTFTTGNTLTFTGGTGIDTTVSDDTITIAVDATIPTASSTTVFTNKTFDANGTGNSITNLEVADLASGVLDTDLSSVSVSDDTLASAKAIKSYVDTEIGGISTVLTVRDDSSTTDSVTIGTDTLSFAGGTGLTSTVTDNTVTFDIDSTVTTLTGSQTLENKTISGSNNTLSNIANASLTNSSITLNGVTINLGDTTSIAAGTDWQAEIVADGSTVTSAVASEGYFINTTSATHTIHLPGSPSLGDEVSIIDAAGTFDTNNLTVGRNGNNINGSAADLTVAVERAGFTLVYLNATQGWLLKDK